MCDGNRLLGHIDISQRSAFRLVIGVSNTIYEKELVEAFDTFYNSLIPSFNFSEAVNKMNEGRVDNPFVIMPTEYFFDKCIEIFIENFKDENWITQQAVIQKATNPNYVNLSFEQVKICVKKVFTEMIKDAENSKYFYMMKDLK